MAIIAGDPHLSLIALHELLTASSHGRFGADREQEQICCCVRVSDPKGANGNWERSSTALAGWLKNDGMERE
jgi:hypothetical protein